MRKTKYAICQCCGTKAKYTDCSERCASPENARCKVLDGWLSVCEWKGMGSVEFYDFCSFTCLQKWVEVQVPKIPETFLKAFEDE